MSRMVRNGRSYFISQRSSILVDRFLSCYYYYYYYYYFRFVFYFKTQLFPYSNSKPRQINNYRIIAV